MRKPKEIFTNRQYKKYTHNWFRDYYACEGCKYDWGKCIGRCLWKNQRTWKKFRKTQYKG